MVLASPWDVRPFPALPVLPPLPSPQDNSRVPPQGTRPVPPAGKNQLLLLIPGAFQAAPVSCLGRWAGRSRGRTMSWNPRGLQSECSITVESEFGTSDPELGPFLPQSVSSLPSKSARNGRPRLSRHDCPRHSKTPYMLALMIRDQKPGDLESAVQRQIQKPSGGCFHCSFHLSRPWGQDRFQTKNKLQALRRDPLQPEGEHRARSPATTEGAGPARALRGRGPGRGPGRAGVRPGPGGGRRAAGGGRSGRAHSGRAMLAARVEYIAPWWVAWLHRVPHVGLRLQPVDSTFRPRDESYQEVSPRRPRPGAPSPRATPPALPARRSPQASRPRPPRSPQPLRPSPLSPRVLGPRPSRLGTSWAGTTGKMGVKPAEGHGGEGRRGCLRGGGEAERRGGGQRRGRRGICARTRGFRRASCGDAEVRPAVFLLLLLQDALSLGEVWAETDRSLPVRLRSNPPPQPLLAAWKLLPAPLLGPLLEGDRAGGEGCGPSATCGYLGEGRWPPSAPSHTSAPSFSVQTHLLGPGFLGS